MKIGAILVLIGVVLVGLALVLPYVHRTARDSTSAAVVGASPLLAAGVLLIGIGCLVGNTAIH